MSAAFAHRPGFLVIEDLAGEIRSLMEELYQSGFAAVHDSTLEELQKTANLSAQYGMQYLSELLGALSGKIEANRHRMRQEIAPLAELYTKIDEYLYICIQKTAYDRGESYYS